MVSIGMGVRVNEGNILSEGYIVIGNRASITGNVIGGKNVKILPKAFIHGDVISGCSVFRAPKAIITGDIIRNDKTLVFPEIPDYPDSAGRNCVIVRYRMEKRLEPGNYGNVFIQSRSTLILTGGVYHINQLFVSCRAKVKIETPTILVLKQQFNFMPKSEVIFEDSKLTPADFLIYTSSKRINTIGMMTKFKGGAIVKKGKLIVSPYAKINGALLAERLFISKMSKIEFENVLQESLIVEILVPSQDTIVNITPIDITYTVNGDTLVKEIDLSEGVNEIIIDTTKYGVIGADTINIILDTQPPIVEIVSPEDGSITNQASIDIVWTVDGNTQNIELTEDLEEGINIITRSYIDEAGNIGADTVIVTLDTQAPVVEITWPEEGYFTSQTPITISWTVDGIEQTGELTEELSEGINKVIRSSMDEAGNIGTDTITVIFDDGQPLIEILSPKDGFTSTSSEVTFTVHALSSIISEISMLIDGEDKTSSFVFDDSYYNSTLLIDDGHHTFIVHAENIAGRRDTTRVSFKVKTELPETEIIISGSVVDGKVFEPIAGVTVEVIETGSSVTTDTEGKFNLPSGGFGNYKIRVTHPDYTLAMRIVSADSGLDVSLPPILIIPLDTNTVTVFPGEDTTVVLPNKVELYIPAGALTQSMVISATLYDNIEQIPNVQPGMDVFLFSIDLKPDGAVFNDSITVRVPNINELTYCADVPVAYFNEQTALWEDAVIGYVTEDGEFIEFKTKYFSCWHANDHGNGGGSSTGDGATGGDGGCDASNTNKGSSEITIRTGDLKLNYDVPGGKALTNIDANLIYWSYTANPKKVIWIRVDDIPFTPTYHAWKIYLPGMSKEWLFHGANRPTGFTYIWDIKNKQNETLETGIYPYGISITDIMMPGRYRYDINKPAYLTVMYRDPTNVKFYYYG